MTSSLPGSPDVRSGAAGLLAAGLFVLTAILTRVLPIGFVYDTTGEYLSQVVLALAYVSVLITLPGLQTRQRCSPGYGRLGVVGTALTSSGYAVVLLVVVVGIVMGSRVLNEVRIVGAVALLLGAVVLGVATLRAREVPWWCGALLIVAFPLGDVANQAFAGAESLLQALLWGSVGAALVPRPRSSSQSSRGRGHQRGEVSWN